MTMRELNDIYTQFVNCTNPDNTFDIQNRCTGLWPSEAVESAFYLFFLASSLIGNVLIVAIFYKDKTLRTTVNCFMLNMCVSDLIIPVINLPLWITYNRSKTIMFITGFPSLGVSISVSLFSMVALAAERFRAIIFPMKPALFPQKKCYVAIAVMWLSSLAFFTYWVTDIIFTIPFCTNTEWNLKNDAFLITFVALMCLSVIAVTLFYLKMAIFLYRQKNSLHLASEVVKKRAKRNRKIITMLIIIVILFYVVWIPDYVMVFLYYKNHFSIPCLYVWFSAVVLPITYPVINPIVYFVFIEKYRQGLRKILCCQN